MSDAGKLSYTMEQAAAATGFTRSRLYQAIADGSLQSLKAGRRRLISRRALEAFVVKLERESAGRAA
jgi:excisionase family DNA binding protein